jgi:hypothetical protein
MMMGFCALYTVERMPLATAFVHRLVRDVACWHGQNCRANAPRHAKSLLQLAQLLDRQHAIGAWTQVLNGQPGESAPNQAHNRESDRLPHPTDLAVLSLFQRQFEPGLPVFDAQNPCAHRLRWLAVNDDRLLETLQSCLGHLALNLRDVDLFHLAVRVQESHRKIAVVRQQQNTTRCVVEASNWHQPHCNVANERGHGGTTFWIICSTDNVTWFVHQHIDEWLTNHRLAVHFNPLPARVSLAA